MSSGSLDISPDADTFRILVATDNHLGCEEQDPIRGNDAMRTFEEILVIAKTANVDFILLGGDLFHQNKPSRQCLFDTMQLLRKHCLGDRPISFEMLSDPSTVFHARQCCNYEDPNINISLPIFAIHGNHDDPSGSGGHAALDILDSANFLNYFGRVENISEFCVNPILLRKGTTQLALYGLGSIRDERLHRTLVSKKVSWARPNQDPDQWFNLLVLHQNRTRHSLVYKNCIPESLLPNFLDLVVWAHEHECRIELEESAEGRFWVTQPGSSAATSLCAAETVKKHVGLVEVRGNNVRLTPIPLQSPRPFIMEDIVLEDFARDLPNRSDTVATTSFLHARISSCIARATVEFPRPAGIEVGASEWLPLIRIRVNCQGYQPPNIHRFGQEFIGRVANPDGLIQIMRKQNTGGSRRTKVDRLVLEVDEDGTENRTKIEDLVKDHLSTGNKALGICSELDLADVLERFVSKGDGRAIEEYTLSRLSSVQAQLKAADNVSSDNIEELARNSTQAYRDQQADENTREEQRLQQERDRLQALLNAEDDKGSESEMMGDDEVTQPAPAQRSSTTTKRKASAVLNLSQPAASGQNRSRPRSRRQ
uniref:Double-strand break repair protein n=1 Tax=Spongospora subterranea TaxID=70186 RepID=A0A0H5R8A3_9EUKA|eukprot:CRZ10363.1 hypothetical protein [Spongospora subterranea]